MRGKTRSGTGGSKCAFLTVRKEEKGRFIMAVKIKFKGRGDREGSGQNSGFPRR